MPRRVRRLAILMVFASLAGLAGLAAAQEQILTAEVMTDPEGYARGQSSPISVRLGIAPGFHINSDRPDDPSYIPTQVRFESGNGISFGPVVYPQAGRHQVQFTPEPLKVFGGEVLVQSTLKVAPDARPGVHLATAFVTFQACNDQMCHLPEELELDFEVIVK